VKGFTLGSQIPPHNKQKATCLSQLENVAWVGCYTVGVNVVGFLVLFFFWFGGWLPKGEPFKRQLLEHLEGIPVRGVLDRSPGKYLIPPPKHKNSF